MLLVGAGWFLVIDIRTDGGLDDPHVWFGMGVCYGAVALPLSVTEAWVRCHHRSRAWVWVILAFLLAVVWYRFHLVQLSYLLELTLGSGWEGAVERARDWTWREPSARELSTAAAFAVPMALTLHARLEHYSPRWQVAYVMVATLALSPFFLALSSVMRSPVGPDPIVQLNASRTLVLALLPLLYLLVDRADRWLWREELHSPVPSPSSSAPLRLTALFLIGAAGLLALSFSA